MALLLGTFMSVMTNIFYIIVAILALMFMIVVHEFGHYIAGKKLGFQINEFAIGFGPPIFKKKLKSGERFSIRPFPLGGYCAFEGEDSENENPKAFNNQKPWKRLIVLFAGAAFNFISAILIIAIYFTAYGQQLSVVSEMYPDGRAARDAIVREGDVILAVDGKSAHILVYDDFADLMDNTGDTAKLRIIRDGKIMTIEIAKDNYTYVDAQSKLTLFQYLTTDENGYKEVEILNTDILVKAGGKKTDRITAAEYQSDLSKIASGTELVFERTVNGETTTINVFITIVRTGDRLTQINDEYVPVMTDEQYIEATNFKYADSDYRGDVLFFQQTIDGTRYNVPLVLGSTLKSSDGGNVADFGINNLTDDYRQTGFSFGFTRRAAVVKLNFFVACGRAFTFSFFVVFKILAMLGGLITGKMSLKDAGGPITVIKTISEGTQSAGLQYLIYIVCILSANLAVMNLLPIPALDGSRMVFTVIEWIRKKPINRKTEGIIHAVGLVVLFTFTIFVDIFHLVS